MHNLALPVVRLNGLACFACRKSFSHPSPRNGVLAWIQTDKRAPAPNSPENLRCARNATFFKHFLAHFPYILANDLQSLTKRRRREGQKVPSNAMPHYVREPVR